MITNTRLLQALAQEPLDRPPVWLMRQAGRYLPEYRLLRSQAGSFMALCKNPALACEVTLQPLARFDLDAAIIFSDILTIPDAMGLGLSFVENEGPQFERPIRTEQDIDRLPILESGDLAYVMQAITATKTALKGRVPLIGFSGSPWTVATYMVEGHSTRHFAIIKKMLYTAPPLLHRLLDKVTNSTIAYLKGQIMAGADALMIFDTWGGVLSHPAYRQFSLAYMHKMVTALRIDHPTIPVTLFTKGGGLWLEDMAATGCQAIGLDWSVDLSNARNRVGSMVALQGNLDPLILLAGPEATKQETMRLLTECDSFPGHIFNLGHGLVPETPLESVQALIETIQNSSRSH